MITPLAKLILVAYTLILGGALFLYFGVKIVLDSLGMEADRVSERVGRKNRRRILASQETRSRPGRGGVANNPIRMR
jgi:hypothetical protein